MQVSTVYITTSATEVVPANSIVIGRSIAGPNCALHVFGHNLHQNLNVTVLGIKKGQEQQILEQSAYFSLDRELVELRTPNYVIIPITLKLGHYVPRHYHCSQLQFKVEGTSCQGFKAYVDKKRLKAQQVPQVSNHIEHMQRMDYNIQLMGSKYSQLEQEFCELSRKVQYLEHQSNTLVRQLLYKQLGVNTAFDTSDNLSGGRLMGQAVLSEYYTSTIYNSIGINWNIDDRLRFITLKRTASNMVEAGSFRTQYTMTIRKDSMENIDQNNQLWTKFDNLAQLLVDNNHLGYVNEGIAFLKDLGTTTSEITTTNVFMKVIVMNNLAVIYACNGMAKSLVGILNECLQIANGINFQLQKSYRYICCMVKLNYTTLVFELYDYQTATQYLMELLKDDVLCAYDIQYCNLLLLYISTHAKDKKPFGQIESLIAPGMLDGSLLPLALSTYGRYLNLMSFQKDGNGNDQLIRMKNQEARYILEEHCQPSWDVCPAEVLFELGRCYEVAVHENGTPDTYYVNRAVQVYSKCYERAIAKMDGEMMLLVTNNLGNAFTKLHNDAFANECFKKSMDLRINLIFQVAEARSTEEAVALVQTCERMNRNWTRTLINQGNYSLALEAVERMKCLTQLIAINRKRKINISWMTTEEMVQVSTRQRQNIVYYYLNSDTTYNDMFNTLYIWVIPYRKLQFSEPLPSNFHTIITEGGHEIYFVQHSISATEQSNWFEAYKHFSTPNDTQAMESSWRQQSDKLLQLLTSMYTTIIEPFEWLITQGHLNSIKFIPYARLELVPFPALYNGKNHLIELLPVSVYSSMRMMQVHEAVYDKYGLDCLLFGAPDTQIPKYELPHGKRQIDKVSTTLLTNGLVNQQVFCEKNVTRENVVKCLKQNPKHVYIYTHYSPHISTSQDNRPFSTRGALYMADEQHLSSHELEDLNIQSDLALIMSCSVISGTGSVEGLMGPIRSLSIAGVRSIIGSLWPLNDQFACNFSDLFYATMTRYPRLDKDEIFQKTCQQLISKVELYHWAGFMLHGSSSFMNSWQKPSKKEISKPMDFTPLIYVLAGVLLSMLFTLCHRLM